MILWAFSGGPLVFTIFLEVSCLESGFCWWLFMGGSIIFRGTLNRGCLDCSLVTPVGESCLIISHLMVLYFGSMCLVIICWGSSLVGRVFTEKC